MAINKITFNGIDFWEEIGATLTDAPNYPIPAEVKELVRIKGANGTLTEATGYFNNLEIDLKFRCLTNFAQPQYQDFATLKRHINKIFNNITDNRLQFGDNPTKYYKVKTVEVGAITKLSEYEVDFEINFICDPFLYSINDTPIESNGYGQITYNGDIPNKPIIKFKVPVAGADTAEIIMGSKSLTITTRDMDGKTILVNANPYTQAITTDGDVLETRGDEIVLSNGTVVFELNMRNWVSHVDRVTIVKNERYLG